MKEQDQYLKFVQWEEDDGLYVGYCPDLFPWGGVCHAAEEQEAYRQLCGLVRDEVEDRHSRLHTRKRDDVQYCTDTILDKTDNDNHSRE